MMGDGTLYRTGESRALSALDYAEIGQLANRYALAIDTCSNIGYDYADLTRLTALSPTTRSMLNHVITPAPGGWARTQ